jgi:hypothetical protein
MEMSCLHLQVGFNLVQLDAEVMCSNKCVRYVGQFEGCVRARTCVRHASSHHNFIYFNQIIRPEDGASICLTLSEQHILLYTAVELTRPSLE